MKRILVIETDFYHVTDSKEFTILEQFSEEQSQIIKHLAVQADTNNLADIVPVHGKRYLNYPDFMDRLKKVLA